MIVNLERRIRKIEAQRFAADPALKAMSDDELAQALREASEDLADHALAAWFQTGCEGPLPPGAFDSLQRSL
ncbi:hypothetical protein MKK69_30110 [Methylobacterium sp. J-026]|uniref:hypothetical protein n=1 Tax=Methylobacterium sp. J-026 TaxID=2836624 RepID=UPI001FB8FBD4|nr:hypothetical protein [Methylobacterium sp. J-026]MCJ2138258.1 hypothetical protein [Methylobacterium sp. J-026]